MKKVTILVAVSAALLLVLAGVLAGCGEKAATVPSVRIGILPTEDALPLFVAEQEGFAKKAGVKIEIVNFQSAQERDAALVAGKIDGFMGDVLAAATLSDKGTPVKIVTVMLGADPTEGRFGIVVPQGSKITQPMQLRGVPVAVSSNTITEYVVDSLLKAEGLADNEVKKVEVKKIPVRVQLLLAGQLKAAGLPDPLLAFTESKGAKLVIADTSGQNLSQTILAFSAPYVEENGDALAKLIAADAQAVAAINADPEKYRKLLVDKAQLPPDIASTYRLNLYPEPQLPAKADVDRALSWTSAKGLTSPKTTYETLVAPSFTEK